jgi:hypothetical protein
VLDEFSETTFKPIPARAPRSTQPSDNDQMHCRVAAGAYFGQSTAWFQL